MELATVVLILGVIGFSIVSPGFRHLVFFGAVVCVVGMGWVMTVSKMRDTEYRELRARQHQEDQEKVKRCQAGQSDPDKPWLCYPDPFR